MTFRLRDFEDRPDLNFEKWNDLDDEWFNIDCRIPTFEPIIITVGGIEYFFIAEEWWNDCLESRVDYQDYETNINNITKFYKKIMINETGMNDIDKCDYIDNSALADYGVSFIARKVYK